VVPPRAGYAFTPLGTPHLDAAGTLVSWADAHLAGAGGARAADGARVADAAKSLRARRRPAHAPPGRRAG
jgi:DNA-binding HxlR family transcriptional regulator